MARIRLVRLVFLLSLFLGQSLAWADSVKGYDALGLAQFCEVFLRAPKLPGLSTLLNTFGDPLPCVARRIEQGGLTTVQIDLIDATCWRNNKCPPGVPKPTDLNAITRRARNVSALAVKYPSIDWWVSPALEHDERDQRVVRKMLDAAKKGCPICKVINSPFSGARVSGVPLELHGTKVTAFAVSGDGASSYDADNLDSNGGKPPFNHSTSGAHQTYLWWNELNLRCTGEKTFTMPLKRTERPTVEQFRQAYLIAQKEQQKPAAPAQCRNVTEISAPWIYKPNAESYCNGVPKDKRSNKPLLIFNRAGKRGDQLKVIAPSGREVACFRYYGPFEKGLHRWYMGDCSGQHPSELFDAFGGEWGFVSLGDSKCLRINSVRRLGVHR